MTLSCLNPGCRTRGHHTNTCATPDCPGCAPRPAEHGHLCTTCRGRLARAILTAPELVHHIRDQRTPSNATTDDTHTTGSRTPPAPLHLGALDDADTIHATTHTLAHLVATHRHLQSPDTAGSWIANHRVVGLTVDATPANIDAPAAWLTPHTDHIAATPELLTAAFTIGDPAGLVPLVEHLTHRWPTATRARHIPAVTCPGCNRRGTLIYHPPSWATTRWINGVPVTESDDVVIQCGREECGYLVPDDRLGWFARLAEDLALERTHA